MVLHPLSAEEPPKNSGRVISAWAAVERTQKQLGPAYWLIAQTDHAALAGDLAANFSCPEFPQLDDKVVQAISLHDAGWAGFDPQGEGAWFHPTCNAAGKPISFFEVQPGEFTRAWKDSVEKAKATGALGAILVSKHFCRLGQRFMHERSDDPGASLVGEFLASETQRQMNLARSVEQAEREIERLVDVLQFCDLMSLYLCCGSQEDVEFPQRLATAPIHLRRNGGAFRLEPSLLRAGASLGVTAQRYPASSSEPNSTSLAFLIV